MSAIAARHGMPNAVVAHAWIDTPDAEEILLEHKQWPLVRGIRTKPVISEGPGSSVRGQRRSLQDVRAPGLWRSNGPIMQQGAFGTAYGCKAGTPMQPKAEQRVGIFR